MKRGIRDYAPQSVTLTLEDEIDISRGDMFVKANAIPQVAREFEAMLCWLAEAPLDKNRKYLVKHTTRTAKCVFSRLEYRVDVNTLAHHETPLLNMNDIARVAMKVQQPLALDHYSKNRSKCQTEVVCWRAVKIEEINEVVRVED